MSDLPLPSSQSTKHTILVVDDATAVVQLCTAILDQAGFSVLQATDSSEALKIVKHHPGPIHLLLTDLLIHPPVSLASGANEFTYVHGHKLVVHALHLRKDLRVILMSGSIDQELGGYGIGRGGLPFLRKPFDAQALLALVRETLQAPPLSIKSLTAGPTGKRLVGNGWFD
jgi:DNA-binding NtrC family response regulator